MSSAYEDTVFDFDLNFLNQTATATNNTEIDPQAKAERLRRSVIFLKKKVLFSHSAVTRYKSARNYANILENNQVFSKEGCKQHLIEIRNFIDKVARLENESRAAETREREKDETICDLQNKIVALQTLQTQLKLLLKEKNNTETSSVKLERKKGKTGVKDNAKKGFVETENETLCKEIAKITNLEKENETLRKENARIPNLEKEIEKLRKKNTVIAKAEKVNDGLNKEIARIQKLEKEIETLRKDNAKIPELEKEIEIFHKENATIPKLEKEIATLRKENVKFTKLGKENETLRKENIKISNLEKEIETLRIKNAKIVNLERVNKALSEEIAKIPNKGKEIETLLTHLTSKTTEKDNVPPKYNKLTRKHKSLSDRKSEWSDNSEAEHDIFEDALSPTPSDTTIAQKSSIADKDFMVQREFDNDNSNEVVSVDTGRGSSLACSDTEKGIHSPEYFLINSPVNGENLENKTKAKDTTMPRSPIVLEERAVPANIPIIVYNEDQDVCEPKSVTRRKSLPKLLSTVDQINAEIEVYNSLETDSVITKKRTQSVHEKECLELNNSLQCESHTDLELEKIFSTMKLNYNAVTPIPRTPTRVLEVNPTTVSSEPSEKILRCMFLSDKSDQLLLKLKGFVYRYTKEYFCKSNPKLTLQSDSNLLESQCDGGHNNINTNNNNIDKLIACFETILKSKQILNEDSIVNTNLEIPDQVFHDDNNLVSISRSSSPEIDTGILQDKGEKCLIQISMPMLQDENQNQLLHDDNNLVSISNPSSPEKDTAILKDQQVENGLLQKSLPKSTDQKQLFNHSVSEELNVDNDISQVTDSVKCPCDGVEINRSSIKDTGGKKAKNKKNTKLEKLKKKFKPKYKIKRDNSTMEKSRIKPKQPSRIIKKVTLNDTCASLNDKDVYEKAVKIMAEINSQQNAKIAKSPPTHLGNDIDSSVDNEKSQNCSITTRSKRKFTEPFDNCTVVLTNGPVIHTPCEIKNTTTLKPKETDESSNEIPLRKRRRRSSSEPLTQYKRVLRSSTVHSRLSTEDNIELSKSNSETNRKSIEGPSANKSPTQLYVPDVPKHDTLQSLQLDKLESNVVSYSDLDVFSEDIQLEKKADSSTCHPKESILCCMIEKYGVETMRPFTKKVPDYTVKQICDKIEQEIATISELPLNDTKNAMNSFVADLRKLNYKHFITGMMKYLTKPERKHELFGKVSSSPAPAMTKAEQILLYVISHLKTHWPSVDIVDAVLTNIEYTLFKLNRTPEFDVIESTSHFYALLCRYFGAKSRLRLFILDAMYCIQFKSVPLIKQCLEVWMHIIPLAHMGIAKSPLVTCLVYLLHFYKCDDKFNRVQEIRNILSRRYFYQITDWNETKILEMFKNSIMDLKDIPIEKKMLRLALIILAKRHGPRWCQNHIIKNLLQPIIEKEIVPNNVKEFCVSMIGPLMKPYPVDMKVHCEIAINQLTDILYNNPSPKMEEAAITSMMFINRHNQHSINKTLLTRKMKPMSPELEKIIRDYVKTRPLKLWKKNLTTIIR